jgi:tetratricopeptide (TPR) repeat protein
MFYNDQPPDLIFYQGLALRALGREDEARARFQNLLEYGEAHMHDDVKIDYFAVSLPDFLVFEDDLNRRNVIHCEYLIGLGALGLGETARAMQAFDRVLAMDVNHLGAWTHRTMADGGSA